MTSEIGILNQSGLALAADSALTITNPNGFVNTLDSATKLFTLSKSHYIGIMTYNDATFMGVSWVAIINGFKKYIGDNVQDKVMDYVQLFVKYLSGLNIYTEPAEDAVIYRYSQMVLNMFTNRPRYDPTQIAKIETRLAKCCKHYEKENLLDIDEKEFMQKYSDILNSAYDKYSYPEELRTLFEKTIFKLVCSSEMIEETFSGIVFAGYGDKELFPTLVKLNFDGRICGQVKVKVDMVRSTDPVDGDTAAAIVPVAQSDIIFTILRGIDPALDRERENDMYNICQQLFESAKDNFQTEDQVEEFQHEVNQYLKNYNEDFNEKISENYVNPVLGMLGALSIEEEGEMARTLVSLTSFKRKYSGDIRTVGGAIDVLTVSRDEGPVWLTNNKHRKV